MNIDVYANHGEEVDASYHDDGLGKWFVLRIGESPNKSKIFLDLDQVKKLVAIIEQVSPSSIDETIDLPGFEGTLESLGNLGTTK